MTNEFEKAKEVCRFHLKKDDIDTIRNCLHYYHIILPVNGKPVAFQLFTYEPLDTDEKMLHHIQLMREKGGFGDIPPIAAFGYAEIDADSYFADNVDYWFEMADAGYEIPKSQRDQFRNNDHTFDNFDYNNM